MSDDAQEQLGSNLEPAETEVESKPRGRTKRAAKGIPDRTWILVEENDDIPPTGLYVGHNGTGYLIRAGEPVSVPTFLLGVLDAAVATVPVTDPTTRRIIGHRERMRFPYRKVAAPDGEE